MIFATISFPSFYGQQQIPLIDYSLSRVVNDVGQFSITVDTKDLTSLGIKSPINRWVTLESIGDNEAFVGIVRDFNFSAGERTAEISGASAEIILSDRTIGAFQSSSRPSGSIASQLLRMGNSGENLPISSKIIDELSKPVSWDGNSENLLDAIQYVADQSGYEWRLKYDGFYAFTFVFQPRIGNDRSRSVILYEGDDILTGSFTYTIEGMANNIVASGTRSTDGGRALTISVSNFKSIQQYGRIQMRVDYYGMLNKATLYSAAREDLARRSNPKSGISFNCTTDTWTEHKIGLGDTISLVVDGFERIVPARITAYSINADGVVDITAEEEYTASISGSI